MLVIKFLVIDRKETSSTVCLKTAIESFTLDFIDATVHLDPKI